jgi:hypothetical protein
MMNGEAGSRKAGAGKAWPWRSWGFYFLNDASLLPMDPIL